MAATIPEVREDGVNIQGMNMSCPEEDRQPPIWIDDETSLPMDSLLIPMHYDGMIDSILVPKGLIADRIEKLAQTIRRDYDGVTVHLMCILKGGSAFFEELCTQLRAIHRFSERVYVPFTFDFIRVQSYKGLESSGTVSVSGMDLASLTGKHCLLVEDIIDTGRTMTHLLPLIRANAAVSSLRVATLLEKRTPKSCGFKAHYCGFSIPDKFVIGYNLDYNDAFRDMGHICVINQKGVEYFADGIKETGGALPPPCFSSSSIQNVATSNVESADESA